MRNFQITLIAFLCVALLNLAHAQSIYKQQEPAASGGQHCLFDNTGNYLVLNNPSYVCPAGGTGNNAFELRYLDQYGKPVAQINTKLVKLSIPGAYYTWAHSPCASCLLSPTLMPLHATSLSEYIGTASTNRLLVGGLISEDATSTAGPLPVVNGPSAFVFTLHTPASSAAGSFANPLLSIDKKLAYRYFLTNSNSHGYSVVRPLSTDIISAGNGSLNDVYTGNQPLHVVKTNGTLSTSSLLGTEIKFTNYHLELADMQTDEGSGLIYLIGNTIGASTDLGVIICLNSSLAFQWASTYGNTSSTKVHFNKGVLIDNHLAITGYSVGSGGSKDLLIMTVNTSAPGLVGFSTALNKTGNDYDEEGQSLFATGLPGTGSGEYYVCGYSKSINTAHSPVGLYLKYAQSGGAISWQQCSTSGTTSEIYYDMVAGANNGMILTGKADNDYVLSSISKSDGSGCGFGASSFNQYSPGVAIQTSLATSDYSQIIYNGSTYSWTSDNPAGSSSFAYYYNGTDDVKATPSYCKNANGCSTLACKCSIVPDFSYSNSCLDKPSQFNNTTSHDPDENVSYNWTIADLNNSSNIIATFKSVSIVYTFPQAGNYRITLTASTDQCTRTVSHDVIIYSSASADFNVAYGTYNITFNSTSMCSSCTLSYTWTMYRMNGDPITLSGSNTSSASCSLSDLDLDDNKFKVCLSIETEHGCKSSICKIVCKYNDVHHLEIDGTGDNVCLGSTQHFQLTGISNSIGNLWYVNGELWSVGTNLDALLDKPGTYDIKVVGVYGCPIQYEYEEYTRTVTVDDNPDAEYIATRIDATTFSLRPRTYVSGYTYQWYVDDNGCPDNCTSLYTGTVYSGAEIRPTISSLGEHNIGLRVTSKVGVTNCITITKAKKLCNSDGELDCCHCSVGN